MAETTTTTAETAERSSRKHRKGVVISKSGDKSIVVQAERRRVHPEYGKVVRLFKKFHAHDERNEAKVGDQVRVDGRQMKVTEINGPSGRCKGPYPTLATAVVEPV